MVKTFLLCSRHSVDMTNLIIIHWILSLKFLSKIYLYLKYIQISNCKKPSLFFVGGGLIFDDKDLHLQAENILITDHGVLQV